MIYQIWNDLNQLYKDRQIEVNTRYAEIIQNLLERNLSYNTPVMLGMAQTIFQDPLLIAHNLMQNSVDEAKGAARVAIIAERLAPPPLQKKMMRHVGDELRHSQQFAKLLELTPFSLEADDTTETADQIEDVFEFSDDLKSFLCRVHSIEIRSWTMLRHYIDILRKHQNADLHNAIPVLEQILKDEINHVVYTGEQIMNWLEESPGLESIIEECFAHTNRETWHDLAHMANFMSDQVSLTERENAAS